MFNTDPAPLHVIRRHPPLVAELARRFTDAPIPAPGETVTELVDLNLRVPLGGADAPAFKAAVYARPDWEAGARHAALTVTIAARDNHCQVTCQQGTQQQGIPVDIGPDSGARLTDGGPWMAIFAATVGAADLLTRAGRSAVLGAIDATGAGPAGVLALTTLVMRAASDRARALLEQDMGTGDFRSLLFENAYNDGYAHGLQRGRKETAIVMVLTERGIPLTDQQRQRVCSCTDPDRLARWFSRAVTAATAAEVLAV